MDPVLIPNAFPQTLDQLLGLGFEQRSVRVYGKSYPQPRLTKWFGPVRYQYSGLVWEPCCMPELLEPIRQRAEALTGARLNSCLANLYRDGRDHIHWHSDDEELFGPDPEVVSLSFGSTRMFEMRRLDDPTQKRSYELQHSDLLFMPRGTQTAWQHRVLKEKWAGPRVNLTFRYCV